MLVSPMIDCHNVSFLLLTKIFGRSSPTNKVMFCNSDSCSISEYFASAQREPRCDSESHIWSGAGEDY